MSLQRSAPLYRQVYELLRRRILDGEHAPGEGVQEVRTAAMLQVSRTPVREALRQLERDGLLVARGTELTVIDLSREEFVETYICRAALERVVAERSARYADPEDLDEMAAAVREARRASFAGDHAAVVAANTRFHDRMLRSARMPTLRQLMETIRGPILVARHRVLADSSVSENQICDEHEAVLAAIRQSDVEAAQRNMQAHMDRDVERGLANFDRIQGTPE